MRDFYIVCWCGCFSRGNKLTSCVIKSEVYRMSYSLYATGIGVATTSPVIVQMEIMLPRQLYLMKFCGFLHSCQTNTTMAQKVYHRR